MSLTCLLQFIEKFREVKELSRQPSVTKAHPNSNGDSNHIGGATVPSLSNGPVVAPPGGTTNSPQVSEVCLSARFAVNYSSSIIIMYFYLHILRLFAHSNHCILNFLICIVNCILIYLLL